MKKMIFYTTNIIVSTIFLSIRFAFFLFMGDNGFLMETDRALIHVMTFIFIFFLLLNMYLSFIESKK